jgi:hypothetical protein
MHWLTVAKLGAVEIGREEYRHAKKKAVDLQTCHKEKAAGSMP